MRSLPALGGARARVRLLKREIDRRNYAYPNGTDKMDNLGRPWPFWRDAARAAGGGGRRRLHWRA
jgi:hypothetical protein